MNIGVDLGGTKIEAVAMAADSSIVASQRLPTPQGDYAATLRTVVMLVQRIEREVGGASLPVGIGHPGALSRVTGRIKNANSTCLNGEPLKDDLQAALGREIRMANDADCLALSEATDGAAAGARTVFAAILGTGVGGGIVVDGRLLSGPNAIAGEWGHNPLPWPDAAAGEVPGPLGWDGLHGAIEDWCSGPGLAADHARVTGESVDAAGIARRSAAGDVAATASLERYEERLARALASVVNLIDPEVIVLGGGVSRIARLYETVPRLWTRWIFSDRVETRLLPAQHGDSSGVRGAARLWPPA